KNTFEPSHLGTLIFQTSGVGILIKCISSLSDIYRLNIQVSGMVEVLGVSGRAFVVMDNAEVNVILISQASSEHSICIASKTAEVIRAKEAIKQEFIHEIKAGEMDEVVVLADMSIIAIVGENMKHFPGASGRLFQSFGRNNINVSAIAQGSSELNISAVISKADLQKGLNALHEAFFLSD